MSNEINLNPFDLQSYATKYKLNSFKNNKNGNLEIFFYLKTRKRISDKQLEELTVEKFIPNLNETFNEIQEQIHSLCGDFYFSKNKFGAAIKQYKLCLDYNSGNIHAIVGLANSFQSLGLNDLAGEKFTKSESFYAWKKTFLDNTLDNERDSIPEKPDDVGNNEFQYVPKNLLFNIAIFEKSKRKLEKSERMFQYIADSEPSTDFPESYIFIDNDESGKTNTDDKISKLKSKFPELEKIKKYTRTQFKIDSKSYKIKSENISYLTTIYSCIPNDMLKSKKISALYFLYLLSNPNYLILKKIIKELNIKIEINGKNDFEPEDLNKKIFKHWLKCVGYEKSLLSMNILDDTLSFKKIIDDTISTGQIIKALNQQWVRFDPETISHNITSKNIAKILTEALEDYVQLYNLNQKVKASTNFDDLDSLLKIFEDKLNSLSRNTSKTNKNKRKNSRKEPITYAQLHIRILELELN